MRHAFVKTLMELATVDHRIMLLVADLGFNVVDEFAHTFPDRFINVGVAEQNMAGIATGLAMCGNIVFTYSIANFPILRCLEQLRNDVCYHNANVISVAVGGGLCYGALGMTHFATEDIAIMRTLPNMSVVAPGDPLEVASATQYLGAGIGPAYLRLGKGGEPVVHQSPICWEFGKAIEVCPGCDLTLIATGGMLATAMDISNILKTNRGISTQVISMHTLKPFDEEVVLRAAKDTKRIVTLEEHSLLGGLGSMVAEVLAEKGPSDVLFRRFGLLSEFTAHVGSQKYLLKTLGLDSETLAKQIETLIGVRK
jgi:transketolase